MLKIEAFISVVNFNFTLMLLMFTGAFVSSEFVFYELLTQFKGSDSPFYICNSIMLAKTDGYLSTEDTNCYNKGSRLADVKSMDELNFLKSCAKGRKDHIWLDGNDIKEEGKWIWSYNNETVSLTDWYSGEPNGKRSENCLMILGSNSYKWKWNDASKKETSIFKEKYSSHLQLLSN
ncbi:hypothetical protein KUTeg_006339 [Tegillarca granosa]|uniref:C-type lectin domain-containing protein n=1 Tax=Tegillarca granosa TaxID=220873 RepID=A0ABQ9FGA1_TEGGR|nr:hypothetical protein KUTeg_006339 [Tegillarca granosa]